MRDGNWIEGAWCRARAKDSFEPEVRFGEDPRARSWPRCTEADVTAALRGLAKAQPPWIRRTRAERAQSLAAVLDAWQADGVGVDQLAVGLGLGPGDFDGELEGALNLADRLLDAEGPAPLGVPLLVRISADQMFEGLMRAVLPALLEGGVVLLVSDPDLPWLAHEFVLQLVREQPLAGVLALLHDDLSVCLSAANDSDFIERVVLSNVPVGMVGKGKRRLPREHSFAFGAGVLEASLSGQEASGFELQASSSDCFAVLRGMNPEDAASQIWAAAFDPLASLSGQRDGQITKVVCHERQLSEFTAALLRRADESEIVLGCRAFVSGAAERAGQLCRLGLDEGATLLRGGPGEGVGFRAKLRDGILLPSVFTNVEPTMGIARAALPVPVLSILRASSDAEARATRELLRGPQRSGSHHVGVQRP